MFEVNLLWSWIFVISAIISLVIALHVLLKNYRSPIHQQFFVYGIISFLYLMFDFFTINASTEDIAINLFKVVNSLYIVSLGFLAYLIKNLSDKDGSNWIILIGPMFIAPLSSLIPREASLTDFGWVVRAKFLLTLEGLVVFAYLISYFVFIINNLYHILKKSKTPWLIHKYEFLIGGLLFQLLGVFVSNILISVSIINGLVAGFFYFISLISIWYALNIKAPKEIKVTKEYEKEKGMLESSNMFTAYKKFLDKFLQVAPADDLGLKTIDFLEYLDRTRLSDVVTYDKLRVILNVNRLGNVNNIQALNKTVEYLESKEWGYKLAQSLLEVLESVLQSIQNNAEMTEAFNTVIISRQEFLKRTDAIYGLSGGRFLEYIQPDSSLRNLPEWNAMIRFYVRLLLPLRKFIIGPIKADFLKIVRSTDVIKFLDVSDDGEIESETVIKYVESLPERRRTEAVRESFNRLLVWTIHRLFERDPHAYMSYLKTVRRITKLNAEVGGVWRSYFSLVERATKELGSRDMVKELILSEGYSYTDLEAFSSSVGLSHDALLQKIVTFEYDPRYQYETHVGLAMKEILANSERCILFTRLGSRVLEVAKDLGEVDIKIMMTISTLGEGIPFNDTSRLLDTIGRELDSEIVSWVVFDNISDLILAVGFEETYVFARRVIDIATSKDASLLLLMNKGAHSEEIVKTFEGLSTKIIEIADKPKLVR